MKVNLPEILEQYSNKRLLVIGDVMLDKYVWGTVDRISPEAPVPVVNVKNTNHHPGGAANVARNIHGLGGKVTLIGLVGEDDSGSMLKSIISLDDDICSELLSETGRETTVKTRIIAQGQQVVRLDRENIFEPKESTIEAMKDVISKSLAETDGVILQDYDKGVFTGELIEWLMERCSSKSVPVYVDPKSRHFLKFSGARLFKPNYGEFISKSNMDDDFSEAGLAFRNEYGFEVLLVTQGERGMSLFVGNKQIQIPTKARAVHDVSGAGDTVIATFALNDVCGLNPEESALLANLAAGRVCEEPGVVPITAESLAEIFAHHHD
ncbi:MAG: PfkB family carbohydrate kinase [Candidatus Neomarinimicrobiota bacterium]|nr:PfkB family carbohydrate kinase [Candidatus Neomarinimicrobiota bacterium]